MSSYSWRKVDRMNPCKSLKARLVIAFASTTIFSCGVILALGLLTFTHEQEERIKTKLGVMSFQAVSILDRDMCERQREIEIAATLPVVVSNDSRTDFLNKLQHTYRSYAWIGFARVDGIVESATGDLLVGINVSARPWFIGALQDTFIGDVHDALLLASLLGGSGEPLRFVDVAAPVRDSNNVTIGVLSAHLYWTWSREVEDLVMGQHFDSKNHLREAGVEMYVLDSQFRTLLAPIGTTFDPLVVNNFPSIKKAVLNREKFATEHWGTAKYYVGIARSEGYKNYKGLGWIVLLRQKESVALADVRALTLHLSLIGGGLTLFFAFVGYVMASQIVEPILTIIKSADRIMHHMERSKERNNKQTENFEFDAPDPACCIPIAKPVKDKKKNFIREDDIGILFSSLRNLLEALDKTNELKLMNDKLEDNVRQRTIELVNMNRQLKMESEEKHLVESILSNILPPSICARLKNGEISICDKIENATIFFSDLVQFTDLSSTLSPIEVVSFLNEMFSMLDTLSICYGVEKIKTIGDAYFAVGGLFGSNMELREQAITACTVLDFALEAMEKINALNNSKRYPFKIQMRIGINTGTIVAGIIGSEKLAFDLWGDAVNVASRMESNGAPGRIQVSAATYQLTKKYYEFEKRGEIVVKGKGLMTTYWLLGRSLTASTSQIFGLECAENVVHKSGSQT